MKTTWLDLKLERLIYYYVLGHRRTKQYEQTKSISNTISNEKREIRACTGFKLNFTM